MALSLHHIILGVFTFLISCTLLLDASSIHSQEDQLKRITKYEIVTPLRLEGRQRRSADTLLEDGHVKEPAFILPIQGEEYILDLHKNDMLFADGYVERTYAPGGIQFNKLPHRTHHCYYQGHVRGSNFSQVALSTCNGLSGVIYLESSVYYLEPLQGSTSEHVIYQPEHAIRDKPWHTFEEDYPEDFLKEGEERLQQTEERHKERVRRDSYTETKYIELIIVADSKEYEKRGTVHAVEERVKAIVNIMDMIYLALNTRVVLASVIVWQEDQFVVSTNPSTALGQFQRWREDSISSLISHDNAQLITGLNFDGSTVGMAALGTMCSRDRSCGVSQDHGNHENDVASTIAHEMGHNLGLIHYSSKDCICESVGNVGCVMAASSGSNPPLNWSSCSVDSYRNNLERGLGACMFNYPKVIFGGPICMNGFLEEGEECDCGPADVCDNPCCVAETCKLHENATCASGACCNNCQLQQSGHLCRNMMNECDLPEYCTGYHEECPANVYRQNGVTCGSDPSIRASCFNGMCTSYDQQCKYIWGPDAQVAHNRCWRYNQQGSAFGNCGIDTSGARVACTKKDKMCGKLLCEGGQNFPLLGSLAEASQGYIFDENGAKRACKAASLDQGDDIPDPGYVADGSPCAENMFCYEYKCINSSMAGIAPCPENCNNNGVCNSESHCHCDDNFAPPTCINPGHGGSEDSGPTMPITPDILTTVKSQTARHSTPHSTRPGSSSPGVSTSPTPTTASYDFPGTKLPATNTILVVVLGVIMLSALVLLVCFVYWKRNTIKRKLKCNRLKSPKHTPPATPGASTTGPSVLKIQHPAHISEAPPSYESHYINFQQQLSPSRVAPEPPSKTQQATSWNNRPLAVPSAPPVKYQKHDDAVMYDEPPKVDFVDPSIPRFNPLPLMSTNNETDHDSKSLDLMPAEEASENTVNRYNPPAPPAKPNPSKPLKPASFEGVVLKPTHTAPAPPSIKPVEQEQTAPFKQVALKPPVKPSAPPQPPVKPPPQTTPRPPVQAPPKPPGQVALKPPGQVALKPPGQTPPKPPGQKPLVSQPPPVLPSSKPVPASRKPVLPEKPSVASKPAVPSKPNKRPALRPPPGRHENINNSASSSTSPEDVKLGVTNDRHEQVDLPESAPRVKPKPTISPKPVNV